MDDRQLLRLLAQQPQTMDALTQHLGLSLDVVHERIKYLQAAGINIQQCAPEGYTLESPPSLLDSSTIRAQLPAQISAELAELDVLWSIDSTNAELLRRPPPTSTTVLLAESQVQGRGRHERFWASPLASNIYLSIARGFTTPPTQLGSLSLATGVATIQALIAIGYDNIGLKWPNDLLVDNCKLCGILIEGREIQAKNNIDGKTQLVIGIGLNVHMPTTVSQSITQPWIDLHTLSATDIDRNALVASLLSHLLPAFDCFEQQGITPFLPYYDAMDILANRLIWIQAHNTRTPAIAAGIANDGALYVKADGITKKIYAGEVSVRLA